MKAKKRIISLVVVALALIIILSLVIFALNNFAFVRAKCIRTDDDSVLYVIGNSPIFISNVNGDNFTSGDEIFIVMKREVADSYPGQGHGYLAFKLKDGTADDLPNDVMNTLEILGYRILHDGYPTHIAE